MKGTNKSIKNDNLSDWDADLATSAASLDLGSITRAGSVIHSEELSDTLATIHTDTIDVEVSDVNQETTAVITFTPHRTIFASIVTSTASIQYGYVKEGFSRSTSAGNILLMLPGREVQAKITPGRLCTVTCSFDNDFAAEMIGPLESISHAQFHQALDFRSSLISSIMLRLMQEALSPGAISAKVASSLGHAMLTECAHWLKAQNDDTKGNFTHREFLIVEQYLANLMGKAPSVGELAAICGFSERYFAKLFREHTGMPVSQYIKAVQLSKAKTMLLDTDLPLKEIAYRLGFSTTANFTSSFRTATGVTPGQFRHPH